MDKEQLIGLVDVTLEYGQGYGDKTIEEEDQKTKIYDCTSKVKEQILNYHLHKIVYTLNSMQYIQSLKFIYKSRNDGHLETLLDTNQDGCDSKVEEITFKDFEEIQNIFFYVSKDEKLVKQNNEKLLNISKDERLVSICIETNQGKPKYIGSIDKTEVLKDENLDTKNKIVVGFGVNANKVYGVTSMFCYFVDKNKYGIIKYKGLLELRAKLKKNNQFKKIIDSQKEKFDEKQKLLANICNLPDIAFFPIANYVMSQ